MAIAKGTTIQQVITPVVGIVEGYQVDQETGEVQYLVVWTDAEGAEHQRYFKDGEIAPV